MSTLIHATIKNIIVELDVYINDGPYLATASIVLPAQSPNTATVAHCDIDFFSLFVYKK
jgi:hypothetical protein